MRKTTKFWKKLFGYSEGDKVRIHTPHLEMIHLKTGIITKVFPNQYYRYEVLFIDTGEVYNFRGESFEYLGKTGE